jgi:hypothetical protein
MKPAVLCLLLLSACELKAARNYSIYALTWSCLSSEGCERTEDLELLDRAKIIDGDDFVDFTSTRSSFHDFVQIVPSDALDAECSWLYGFSIFAIEAEPAQFCWSRRGFELELSIPNRDSSTHSAWFVEGREID